MMRLGETWDVSGQTQREFQEFLPDEGVLSLKILISQPGIPVKVDLLPFDLNFKSSSFEL